MLFDIDMYLKDLEKIVNIDSDSYNISGVMQILEFFEIKYKKLNYYTKRHKLSQDVSDMLEVRNKPKEDIDVLLIGHMDTVFPKGTVEKRPFEICGNLIKGPGVIDMKGPLLSIYYAIKVMEKDLNEMPSICILLTSDEEISSRYSKELIKKIAVDSKYVIIPARSSGPLVIQRKGLAKYDIKFKGKAAHSGVDPENGVSAINELAEWINTLNKFNNFQNKTTVNPGVIKGGTQANVIAEEAKLALDIRFTDKKYLKKIEDKMEFLIENPKTKGVKIEVKRVGYRPPMNPNEETLEISQDIISIGKELGIEIIFKPTGGGSDANFTSDLNIPSFDSLGPIGGKTHSLDEYMYKDSIESRLNLLIEVIKYLSSRTKK